MHATLFLFDIDGTLIHCQGAGRRAFERACESILGPGALRDITLDGKTDPLILREAFAARVGREPTRSEAIAIERGYLDHLRDETGGAEQVSKLPHVDEALRRAEARGVLGLATGNWQAGARIKLSRVELWARFALGGFGCDALERGELVRVARARGEHHLGRPLRREDVLVIGDTPRDIQAAHEAGVLAAGVATGRFDAAALRAAGADVVYEDLSGLIAALPG